VKSDRGRPCEMPKAVNRPGSRDFHRDLASGPGADSADFVYLDAGDNDPTRCWHHHAAASWSRFGGPILRRVQYRMQHGFGLGHRRPVGWQGRAGHRQLARSPNRRGGGGCGARPGSLRLPGVATIGDPPSRTSARMAGKDRYAVSPDLIEGCLAVAGAPPTDRP
jgi:hypothetical protein